jgi:hypothetical protein
MIIRVVPPSRWMSTGMVVLLDDQTVHHMETSYVPDTAGVKLQVYVAPSRLQREVFP